MPEIKLSYEQLIAENAALRKENRRLRQQLGLKIPEPLNSEPTTDFSPTNTTKKNPFEGAAVTGASSADEKIYLFMSLFRGRDDVYAKRWYSAKTDKSGYSPVCLNEWEPYICDKRKYKCNNCPNRKLAPLDKTAIFQHLSGKSPTGTDVVGIYPMTADECCCFLAIDFDNDDWQKDIMAFRSTCEELGIAVQAERSRSGNGGHIWFFFDDLIPASTARKFGSVLLTHHAF
ncbi:MAG: hypothetical protein PHV32_04795 [Eubacteriales bacterium]|nr:hypothetical protein [Oscillospiraceae bacterium]MDD4493653.1 hypothetical protein [Eubacteriales bacterium]